ncbi:MAG TPA: CHAT domain-containing protein, partial [Acidimicrobiia bacterium]|nr:CHAT domain-containing protein [Acidimicrobiia bacterium]
TLEGSGTVPFSASEGATRISVCQFDVDLGDVCYSAPFEVTAPDLSVDPTELQPGESLTFTGSGWCCDGATGAVFAGDPARPWGSVEVDEVGNLTGQATVPAEQPAGPVDVNVCVAEGCRQVGITILPSSATTISTPATTTAPTTSTVPSTTTTADPAEALCELEPGSLVVDPTSGVPGAPITVSLAAGPESPEVCHLQLTLSGQAVGEPFDLEPGAGTTISGVVPNGIAVGRGALEAIDTATNAVAGAIGFDVRGEGLSPAWILAGLVVAVLIGAGLLVKLWPRAVNSPAWPLVPATGALWPTLDVPANIEAGRPFRCELAVTSADGRVLPALDLDVELIADGYEMASTRHRLRGRGRERLALPVDITARPVANPSIRRIVTHVYTGGHLVGWAQADPMVFPAGAGKLQGGNAPVAGVPLGRPDGPPPDLTMTISRGDDARFLVWGLGTDHPVRLPTVKVGSDLGKEDARAFAHDEVLGLASTDPELVGIQLGGVAAQIGGRIPAAVWQALADIAPYAAAAGRPPVVLIVSEETYVPWELAAVPPALVTNPAAPKVLGAQMVVGRWMPPDARDGLNPEHPRLPPSAQIDVKSITVVLHGEEAGASSPLPFAIEEATALVSDYSAVTIPAATAPVAALLELRAQAGGVLAAPDIVHFACHGKVDPARPARSGIVLQTASGSWVPVTPSMLRGSSLLPRTRPLVFINACSTGTPQEALDGFGGLVGAALKSGARGVVAPLWEVIDRPARDSAIAIYSAALGDGLAMGEALRRVRTRATETAPTERSFLAYVYFGHPWLKLTAASPSGAAAVTLVSETAT